MPIRIQRLDNEATREACIRWLARDVIHHLVLLGDLYLPLIGVSEIFVATEDDAIVGVGSLFRGFAQPAVVLSESSPTVQEELLRAIYPHLDGEWMSVHAPASTPVFSIFDAPDHRHIERHMVFTGQISQPPINARRVEPSERDTLDRFYRENGAFAWTPLMFDMGPYYAIWRDGEVASAAGVHFLTPYIAQIGNVFTLPAFRGKGFGAEVTAAVASHLQRMSIPRISLFVVSDNIAAIRIYERLGFKTQRDVAFAHFPRGVKVQSNDR